MSLFLQNTSINKVSDIKQALIMEWLVQADVSFLPTGYYTSSEVWIFNHNRCVDLISFGDKCYL